MQLRPSDIFYSQDSINNRFDKNCRHAGCLIGDTLDDLCEGRCLISSIPTIKVKMMDGKWVTCDNRRLWMFRHLERLGKVDEVPVQVTSYIQPLKLTSDNGGRDITVRRNAGGHWRNRPSKRQEPTKAKAAPTDPFGNKTYASQQTYTSTTSRPSNYMPPNSQRTYLENKRDTSVNIATKEYGYSSGTYKPQYPAYTAEIQRPTQSQCHFAGTRYSTTSPTSADKSNTYRTNYNTKHPSAVDSHYIKTEIPSTRQKPKPTMNIESKRPSVVESRCIKTEPSYGRRGYTAVRTEDDDDLWNTRRQTVPTDRRPLNEDKKEVAEKPCCCAIL